MYLLWSRKMLLPSNIYHEAYASDGQSYFIPNKERELAPTLNLHSSKRINNQHYLIRINIVLRKNPAFLCISVKIKPL